MTNVGAIERIRRVRAGERNVGGTERLVRGTLGPALIVAGIAALAGIVRPAPGIAGLAVGVVLLLAGARMTGTAITRRCYANAIVDRNSYRPPGEEPGSDRHNACCKSVRDRPHDGVRSTR